MPSPHRIVVVGAGAGGLELATRLGDRLGRRNQATITMLDAQRRHLWKPLLHEVAAGTIDPAEHALSLLAHARKHHLRFRIGNLESIDREHQVVWLAPTSNEFDKKIIPRRCFSYDTLVIAVGSVSNDFGIPGVAEHCWFLDSFSEAEQFQRRLLEMLLFRSTGKCLKEPIDRNLDVAIVGAGATGVELAAQLHHVTRQLSQYGLDALIPEQHIRINLLEAGPRILPALPECMSIEVSAELESLGVCVLTDCRVTEVTESGIRTSTDTFLPATIKVWAAGIRGPDCLAHLDGLETNSVHQLKVGKDLLTTVDKNIYAIGDCAACPLGDHGEWVPPRAQAAHQEAQFVAQAIERRVQGRTAKGQYVYHDYGSLVTLGHYSTVGNLMGRITGKVRISGWIARMVYLSLYKMHQVALHGWVRTSALSLANLLRRSVNPQIKLH